MDLLARFLEVMIPLLVAVDPLGLIPVYVGMTGHLSPERRRRVSVEALLKGLAVCVGFMFLGQAIFRFLGITEADFRIAGGIILLVLAVLDLLICWTCLYRGGRPCIRRKWTAWCRWGCR
jgi:multiple antibiotic resistance protein